MTNPAIFKELDEINCINRSLFSTWGKVVLFEEFNNDLRHNCCLVDFVENGFVLNYLPTELEALGNTTMDCNVYQTHPFLYYALCLLLFISHANVKQNFC